MANATKIPMIIRKYTSEVETPQGKVELVRYRKVNTRCLHKDDVHVGDKIRIIAGKKIPLGTEAAVIYVGRNKFETEEGANPCILLKYEDGTEVWTTGNNCCNITTLGVENEIREVDEFEFCNFDLEKAGYVSNDCVWYFEGEPGKSNIVFATANITDHGYSIAKEKGTDKAYFKDTGNCYAMVISDWHTNTFSLLVIKKVYVPGNCVALHHFGTRDKIPTNCENTGFLEAVAEFEAWIGE